MTILDGARRKVGVGLRGRGRRGKGQGRGQKREQEEEVGRREGGADGSDELSVA